MLVEGSDPKTSRGKNCRKMERGEEGGSGNKEVKSGGSDDAELISSSSKSQDDITPGIVIISSEPKQKKSWMSGMSRGEVMFANTAIIITIFLPIFLVVACICNKIEKDYGKN